jgi:predicted nucleic acid-binding protein
VSDQPANKNEVIAALQLRDSTYLELAIRLSLPLATFDAQLITAARSIKLPIWIVR